MRNSFKEDDTLIRQKIKYMVEQGGYGHRDFATRFPTLYRFRTALFIFGALVLLELPPPHLVLMRLVSSASATHTSGKNECL